MAGKSIGSAILEDLKNIPRNLLKPYYKGGKLNANKVMIDLIPFTILFYVTNTSPLFRKNVLMHLPIKQKKKSFQNLTRIHNASP